MKSTPVFQKRSTPVWLSTVVVVWLLSIVVCCLLSNVVPILPHLRSMMPCDRSPAVSVSFPPGGVATVSCDCLSQTYPSALRSAQRYSLSDYWQTCQCLQR